jgi:hypothetical protein
MRFIINSIIPSTTRATLVREPVNLFVQYFKHNNEERNKEILFCLEKNIENLNIDNIYLLNETKQLYTETIFDNKKIIQVQMGHRMKYSDVFFYVNALNIQGWIIIANADIFLDNTIDSIQNVNIKSNTIFAQLRYEYTPTSSTLFGPRADSQDSWIYHSAWNDRLFRHHRAFAFELGQAGCDNHVAYLFQVLGFNLCNVPTFIKTYHYHTTGIREYKQENTIKPPYCQVVPYGMSFNPTQKISWYDNDILFQKVLQKEPFIIPRIAGIENNIAVWKTMDSKFQRVMKNNAGIKISNQYSCDKYSKMYFKAFKNCEIYTGWDKPGDGFSGKVYTKTHEYTEEIAKGKKIWGRCLDVFNYIYSNTWTQGLKGKRILIVSAFCDTIEKQLDKPVYPVNLFPDCTFVFIKPPQTQGDNPSQEWNLEIDEFYYHLNKKVNDYDIALVSAGGYGNLICNYIFEEHNKSAIYVGGVLQMYFGIYGQRWLIELPSIVKMYMNEYWVRVSENERPMGYKQIEAGAYF